MTGILTLSAVAVVLSACAIAARYSRANFAVTSTQAGAKLGIETLLEWSKWMAGIEVAALGGLSYLTFHGDTRNVLPMTSAETLFDVIAFAALGTALLCVAWIMSSLSSFAIRIYSTDKRWADKFDIHEESMWARGGPSLSYILLLHHWLWGAGLVAVGIFVTMRVLNAHCRGA